MKKKLVFILVIFAGISYAAEIEAETALDPEESVFDSSMDLTEIKKYYDELNSFNSSEDGGNNSGTSRKGRKLYNGAVQVPNQMISNLLTELWNNDVNSYELNTDFAINAKQRLIKGQISKQNVGRLYSKFSPEILNTATYKAFLPLLDNYRPYTGQAEVVNQKEVLEMSNFLDAIINTSVMKTARQFLARYNLVPLDKKAFKAFLYDIWFSLYSRQKGVLDSSGFEHVFVGEFKNGEVSGLHNWISLARLQHFNKLGYKGFFYMKEPNMLSIQFDWLGNMKKQGSLFVGTSPEFDMAMFTTCFLLRPNGACEFQINKRRVKIISYQLKQGGNRRPRVGTSFPI